MTVNAITRAYMPSFERRRRMLVFLSSTICIVIGVAWTLSQFWSINARSPVSGTVYSASISGGVLEFVVSYFVPKTLSLGGGPPIREGVWISHEPKFIGSGMILPSYSAIEYPRGKTNSIWIRLPLWLVLSSIAIVSAAPIMLIRKRHWYQCEKCNYNLFGLACGVCPECGTTIPEAQWNMLQKLACEVKATTPASGR